MKKTTMAEYLGRPLTSIEVANYEKYLSVAMRKLEDLLCAKVTEKLNEKRRYQSRENYRSIFTDPLRSMAL
jgi:hypothetical protein